MIHTLTKIFYALIFLTLLGCDSTTTPVTLVFDAPEPIRIRQISSFNSVYVEISVNQSVPARQDGDFSTRRSTDPIDLLINQSNDVSIYWFDDYITSSDEIEPLYLGRQDATIDLLPGKSDYDITADFIATGLANANEVGFTGDDGRRFFERICSNSGTLLQLPCSQNPCAADYDGDRISNIEEILTIPASDPLNKDSPRTCFVNPPIDIN